MLKRITVNFILVIASVCAVVVVSDLVLRRVLRESFYGRPTEMFRNPWPWNEEFTRFEPNVSYHGAACGGLGLKSGDPEHCEYRDIVFVTDELGFRNVPGQREKPNEVILVGDSFGVGAGSTQDRMLAAILRDQCGIQTYNLSMPGAGPWHELMTLKAELSNINTTRPARVLWLLFSGNDLEDRYSSNVTSIRRNGFFERLTVRWNTFFARSPIRMMLAEFGTKQGEAQRTDIVVKEFVDGRPLLFNKRYEMAARRTKETVCRLTNYRPLLSVLQEMRDWCAAQGLELAGVLVPTKEEVYWWALKEEPSWTSPKDLPGFGRVVEEFCDSSDIRYIDLKTQFIDASREVFESDGELLW